jgi:hypothetical protein
LVAGGVFLRRAGVSADEIDRAWDELFALIRRRTGEPPADPQAQEEAIAAEIKAMQQAAPM